MAALEQATSTGGGSRHGIQSVEIAIEVLRRLAGAHGPMPLGKLSEACGLSKSKTHRYLHSLSVGGLVHQDRHSGEYSIGTFALKLGMTALQQAHVVGRALSGLRSLSEEIKCHVAIAIWTDKGPVIVKWQRHLDEVFVAYTAGQALPVISTATGQVFASHLSRSLTAPFVEREIAAYDKTPHPLADTFEDVIVETRKNGYAALKGTLVAVHSGVSVPLFSPNREIVAVTTALLDRAAPDERIQTVVGQLKAFGEKITAGERHMEPVPFR